MTTPKKAKPNVKELSLESRVEVIERERKQEKCEHIVLLVDVWDSGGIAGAECKICHKLFFNTEIDPIIVRIAAKRIRKIFIKNE